MGDFGNNVFGGSGLYSGVFEASPFISSISILNCATHTSCGEGTQSSPGGARIVPRNSPRSGAGARWGTRAFGPHPMPAPGSPEHPLVLRGHAVDELFTQVFFWGWKHLKKKKIHKVPSVNISHLFWSCPWAWILLHVPKCHSRGSRRSRMCLLTTLAQGGQIQLDHTTPSCPAISLPSYSCSFFFFFLFSLFFILFFFSQKNKTLNPSLGERSILNMLTFLSLQESPVKILFISGC